MAITAVQGARSFPTDKITYHGYFPAYRQIASQLGPATNVCEVGILGGESLRMWQAFFPDGLIAGVDSNPDATWPEGTARIVASQDSETLPSRLAEISPSGFGLIVDDASHDGALTRRTWELLWPLVAPGGFYVIEDWTVGLGVPPWQGYGDSMLRTAESFLPLLDSRTCDPESIEYRYGMIIMRRKPRPAILCCYVNGVAGHRSADYAEKGLEPETAAALAKYAPDAVLVDVTGDPHGYWAEIAARWDGERDLVIVEQDNEITADTIPSFMACPEPWCTYAYPIYRTKVRLEQGLGCVKISAAAQRMTSPAEIAETWAPCPSCHGKGCWNHLDGRLAEVFRHQCGLSVHVHGDIIHCHDYPAFDPLGPAAPVGRPIEWHFGHLDDDDSGPDIRLDGRRQPEVVAVTGRQACAAAEELLQLAAEHGMHVPQSTWTES